MLVRMASGRKPTPPSEARPELATHPNGAWNRVWGCRLGAILPGVAGSLRCRRHNPRASRGKRDACMAEHMLRRSPPSTVRKADAGVIHVSLPRLGVCLRHHQRALPVHEQAEPEASALGQQLPDLHLVLLAAALLIGPSGVTVEEPHPTFPLAEQHGKPALAGELRAVSVTHS